MAQNAFQAWFLVVFHVSPCTRPWKTKENYILWIFLKISAENRPIFAKNGSRALKSRYLKITFLNRSQERKVLESWNLAKLEKKWVQKINGDQNFGFCIFWLRNPLCVVQNRFWTAHIQFFTQKMQNSKIWTLTFFWIHFFSTGQISAL